MSAERPILFSGAMVRALLAGTKTQTRRIVKVGDWPQRADVGWFSPAPEEHAPAIFGAMFRNDTGADQLVGCPYGQPGDRLWVRETWGFRGRGVTYGGASDNGKTTDVCIQYAADETKRTIVRPSEGIEEELPKQHCLSKFKNMGSQHPTEEHYAECLTAYWRQWRPSIFMRRWMSRLTLEVIGVRVDRLQDISETDAKAEGIEHDRRPFVYGWHNYGATDLPGESLEYFSDPRDSYRSLWESINGKNSWSLNPWVWVVSFKRVTP